MGRVLSPVVSPGILAHLAIGGKFDCQKRRPLDEITANIVSKLKITTSALT